MKKAVLIVLTITSVGIVSGLNLYRGSDRIEVNVPVEGMKGKLGKIDVRVLDVDDEMIGQAYKYIYVTRDYYSVPFKINLKRRPQDRDLLRVRVTFKKKEAIYSTYQLEDRMVVKILGQNEFIKGTPIDYRIIVRNQRDNAPIEDARVKISMKTADSDRVIFEGKTDRSGTCETDLKIPEQIDEADLHFVISSRFGEDEYDTMIKMLSGNLTYVVTDKPIYQPGQTIHIRSLSLRRPDLNAVQGHTLIYEVEDSKGNKVFKKQVETDDFGVGYVQFVLADEVNLGDYTIRVILDQEKVEKTVNVMRYVLPKFKVALTTDKEYYMPGEKMEGDIDVQYFFGKPVVNGIVKITTYKYDIGFQQEAVIEGKTNQEGRYHFSYQLPDHFVGQPLEKGDAFVRLDVEVIDPAKHGEKISAKKKIVQGVINLAVVPEGGVLKPGLENRIYVLASYPDGTPCFANIEMRIDGRRFTGRTDEYGIAEFNYKPGNWKALIAVRATDDKGETAQVQKSFEMTTDQEQIVMKMARGIYEVGEAIELTLLTTKRSGRAYLDIIKDNQTVLTKSITIKNGEGRFKLNLTHDITGSLWLHAYIVTHGSSIIRDTRFCYVHAADDLLINVKAGKDEYVPGEDGNIVFKVTDQKGRPTVAALCVAVVDEAVFAVSELQPGLEKVYFRLEEEIMKPRYEIHGFSPVDIVKKQTGEARAENVMFSTLVPRNHYAVSYTTPQLVNEKIKSAFFEKLQHARNKIYEAINEYYRLNDTYPKTDGAIATLLEKRLLQEVDLRDPWGRRYRVDSTVELFHYFTIVSAGPDGVFDNEDDINEMMWQDFMADGPMVVAEMAAVAPGAGARMAEAKSKTSMDLDKPGSEPRVREFFPETFIFEPALITDYQGHAQLSVTMPDAITTWRITTFASSSSGQLGSALAQLKVFQDFFVDIDLPVALTEGDEIAIPIAIYNYLPRDQRIRLVLEAEDWFEALEATEIVRDLKQDEVSVAYFPIRVKQIGYHSLLVKAYGEVKSDAIKRAVAVLPDGKLFEELISDRLSGTVKQRVAFPPDAIEDANWLGLKIFPGIFSQVVEGLDNLLGVPFGCFEQTTSVTYPNILILDYLRQTDQIKPETEMTAEEYISLGYQRLLTFEVAGGGFSWFGDAPANKVLTAYGLMEFNDMAQVYDIDERIIERTARWLRDQQNKDGSWSPDAQYLHAEAWSRIQKNEILPTAYICWALGEIGDRGPAIDKGLDFLKKNLKAANDPYILALVANAFVAVDPKSPTTLEILKKLVGMAKKEKDAVYWQSDIPSITFTRGQGADIEATGLALYALIKSGKYSDVVTDALTYLIRTKDKNGVWYTTQGTIIALRSLVAVLVSISEDIDAQLTVIINGQEVAELNVDKSNADLMHQIDLSKHIKTQNTVEIEVKGEGNFLYEIVSKYYLPWEIIPRAHKAPFTISVDYDRTSLTLNDIVDVDVRVDLERPGRAQMVMVDLGIPPGFEVLTPTLDELVGKTIQKYSLTPRQIIIYLDEVSFGKSVNLSYQLQAKFPIRAKVRASRVYEYYNTTDEAIEQPFEMRVTM
ncbi:hypothetical protein AMJ83_03150 [candidate division WOR_3 bacterium SM23_42]|uniref:Alpha-2-macroglobulin domain-containing protein n=1 Tax=candidate division WOR_3 bacterium SM23_42 TaxID=1703779 RepID=A0A0S8FU45_UNCW3|nr:MAG: hypothetical protein AMJ83_03150 [candidate division WOR_3 bacterium SM23_42]